MLDLDSPPTYRRLDPSGTAQHLASMAEHCRIAWREALEFPLPPDYSNVDKVVVLGMGGSGISGDLLHDLATVDNGPLVLVHRDYSAPPVADSKTLIIASSHSGNTEETVSAFRQALKSPAKVIAITTGGELGALARDNNVPLFLYSSTAPPRASLGYLFTPPVVFLQRLGLLSDKNAKLAETVEVMDQLAATLEPATSESANPAKQMARKLCGKLVVIYGAGFLSGVARRWKTQLNENAKAWAFFELLPELNHNAVVGLEYPQEMTQRLAVVMLYSSLLYPRVRMRYPITGELLERAGVEWHQVQPEGESPMAQMMSLILFGDYVSYYLAILNERDPWPVETIDHLKGRLKEGND